MKGPAALASSGGCDASHVILKRVVNRDGSHPTSAPSRRAS